MAYAQRPTYTTAIPDYARIIEEGGERFAVWTDRKGTKVKAPVRPGGKCFREVPNRWVGIYTDHNRKKAKTPTFGTRRAAEAAAIAAEEHAVAVREGRASIERPKGKVRLMDYVEDFIAYLEREGTGEKRRADVKAVLDRCIPDYGLTYPGTVDAEQLAKKLEADRKKGNKSIKTRNDWTLAFKQFGRWLDDTGRADNNPFRHLPMANHEKDRRRVRRSITPEELDAIVSAARTSPDVVQCLYGRDRAALYLLASFTALRAGALFALLPESFERDGEGVPTAVFSSAAAQKSGEAHGVAIHPSVGKELATWLAAKTPGQPVFRKPAKTRVRTSELLQHDLKAAKIPFRDAAGRVFDFHSLRRQFGVMSAKAGVALVFAQQLMQHSTPVLTANIYSQVGGGELAAEVAKLPVLPSLGPGLGPAPVVSSRAGATGVNGRTPQGKRKTPRKA